MEYSSLKKSLKTLKLNENTNFTAIDIDYTKEEKDILSKIKVKKKDRIMMYGIYGINKKIDSLFHNSLENDYEDCKKIREIIKKLIITAIKSFKEESALIHVRVSLPNSDFKIPRWHIDGPFFGQELKLSPKFVTTLTGPDTMLYKNSKKLKKQYNQMLKKQYDKLGHISPFSKDDIENRKEINKLFNDKNKLTVLKKYQAGVFLVGSNRYGNAFHSEPHINADRVYIAVLPGKKEEIQSYKKTQNKHNKLLKTKK